jgi:putative heme iron utilization protein
MADQLTPEISDRICKHMNDDHASAVLVYAQVHGAIEAAEKAEMLSIDPNGMELSAEVAGNTQKVRVVFDRELTDSEDAHQMLIQMARSGRSPKV